MEIILIKSIVIAFVIFILKDAEVFGIGNIRSFFLEKWKMGKVSGGVFSTFIISVYECNFCIAFWFYALWSVFTQEMLVSVFCVPVLAPIFYYLLKESLNRTQSNNILPSDDKDSKNDNP